MLGRDKRYDPALMFSAVATRNELPVQTRPSPLRIVSYEEYRDNLQICDIGLVVGEGVFERAIQRITRSPYSHWQMHGWVGSAAALSESTYPRSRTVPLRPRVKAQSGMIDVYRLRPELARVVDLEKAWDFMFRAGDQDYPESQLIADWRYILSGRGRAMPNSDSPEELRVCSQLGHAALRVAGMPPMEEYDCWVFPRHGAYPTWTSYVCTLAWEEQPTIERSLA